MKIIYDLPDDNLSKIKKINKYKVLLIIGITILVLSIITFIASGILFYIANNPQPNATQADINQLGGAGNLLISFGYGFGFFGLGLIVCSAVLTMHNNKIEKLIEQEKTQSNE